MPAFKHTKVDSNRLIISARNIKESITRAEKSLVMIDEYLLKKLKPSWSGEGSTAFYERYATDSQNFSQLFAQLKILNEQLKQAAHVYNKADDEASNLVRSLSIG